MEKKSEVKTAYEAFGKNSIISFSQLKLNRITKISESTMVVKYLQDILQYLKSTCTLNYDHSCF